MDDVSYSDVGEKVFVDRLWTREGENMAFFFFEKLFFVSIFSRSYPPRGNAKEPSEPLAFIPN